MVEWRSVSGYEGVYSVSSDGEIRSEDRLVDHNFGGKKKLKSKTIKQFVSGRYKMVSLCKKGSCKNTRVHKIVVDTFLKKEKGKIVDHINRNPLDNRLENLRHATKKENGSNSSYSKGVSNFRGVSRNSSGKKWRVIICAKYIGVFDCELDAARAYNLEAKRRYGEFAFLNEIKKYRKELTGCKPFYIIK